MTQVHTPINNANSVGIRLQELGVAIKSRLYRLNPLEAADCGPPCGAEVLDITRRKVHTASGVGSACHAGDRQVQPLTDVIHLM